MGIFDAISSFNPYGSLNPNNVYKQTERNRKNTCVEDDDEDYY